MASQAERLQEAIQRAGKSHKQLIREGAVTQAQLYRVLNGERGLGHKKAATLARALGVSPGWLLGLEEESGPPPVPAYTPTADLLRLFTELEKSKLARDVVLRIARHAVTKRRAALVAAFADALDLAAGRSAAIDPPVETPPPRRVRRVSGVER